MLGIEEEVLDYLIIQDVNTNVQESSYKWSHISQVSEGKN